MGFKIMSLYLVQKKLSQTIEENQNQSFSDLLKQCRKTLGMKQFNISEFLGMPYYRYRCLENGIFSLLPTTLEMLCICDFFGFDFEDLQKRVKKQLRKKQKEENEQVMPEMPAKQRYESFL